MTLLRYGAYALGGVTGLAAIFGGGIWAGYSLNTQMQNRFSFPAQIHYKLNGMYNAYFNAGATPEPERVVTNRAILTKKTVYLPAIAKDFAGGIGAFMDRSILVTDRLGRLFHVHEGGVDALDILPPDENREALQAQLDAGELGDIEVTFNWMRFNDILHLPRDGDADGAARGYLLISYTEWLPEKKCFGSALARLAVDGEDPSAWSASAEDWDIIARTEPCLELFKAGKGMYGLEAGGRMDPYPDGRIVWTSGAYERDDRFKGRDFDDALGQSDDVDYGKVMLVDVETGAKEVIAKGLRNPQGVSVAPDGRIWVSDHGMQGGDELNLVFEGANFGFPAVSYGTKYNRKPAGNGPRHAGHEGYDKPIIAFMPAIAPSSALALDGFHYAWDGDVLVGALSGAVHRVHIEGDRAPYAERIEMDMRIRDMAKIDGGKTIVLYADDRRLAFLTPDTAPDPMARFDNLLRENTADPLQFEAAETTMTACLQCHSLLEGVNDGAGPSLHRVCGKAPGSGDYDGYSGALGGIGGVWTAQTMSAFFADPYALAPDTNMGWGGLEDTAVADAIAEALCAL